MLKKLFRLDGTPPTIDSHGTIPPLGANECLESIVFSPKLSPLRLGHVKEMTFVQVAFSKVTIQKTTFTRTTFEDCLFISSMLEDVEFHRCKFKNCTFWKTRFHEVYLDPKTIYFDDRYRREAANVGILLYQNLLQNYATTHQDKFYIYADIEFRRWKRYQLPYQYREGDITWFEKRKEQLLSKTYEVLAGFGYRPARFFLATVFLFMLISSMNYFLLGNDLATDPQSSPVSFIDAIFYSFSILTVLGFSSIVPETSLAKLLTVIQALAAIGWLAVFTSVLVKRFIR